MQSYNHIAAGGVKHIKPAAVIAGIYLRFTQVNWLLAFILGSIIAD